MAPAQRKIRSNKGWANLIPCKPGEVRNPRGRPKKIPWDELMERWGDEKVPGQKITFRELHASAPWRFIKDFRFWLAAWNLMHGRHPAAGSDGPLDPELRSAAPPGYDVWMNDLRLAAERGDRAALDKLLGIVSVDAAVASSPPTPSLPGPPA